MVGLQVGIVDPSATRRLRRAVLRPGLAPSQPMPGDDVPSAVHIGVTDVDGAVVGTCFVFPEPCPWRPDELPSWHLRQMASAPDRRGQGIGALVLAGAVDYVRSRRARLLWCNARETAVGFYARYGFVGHGELFLDTEHPVPHLQMSFDLSEPAAGTTSS
jgi:GNAT superfamily N-acetyltransferase